MRYSFCRFVFCLFLEQKCGSVVSILVHFRCEAGFFLLRCTKCCETTVLHVLNKFASEQCTLGTARKFRHVGAEILAPKRHVVDLSRLVESECGDIAEDKVENLAA